MLVDTQGPQLSLASPDASVAIGSPVTLAGAAVDSTSAVSAFTVDFGTGAQSVTVASDGGWSTMATFPAGLDRVSRSVTLRGQDSLGNQGQHVAQVLVDTQGPVLSLRTPDAGVAVAADVMRCLRRVRTDGPAVRPLSVGLPARRRGGAGGFDHALGEVPGFVVDQIAKLPAVAWIIGANLICRE